MVKKGNLKGIIWFSCSRLVSNWSWKARLLKNIYIYLNNHHMLKEENKEDCVKIFKGKY